MIDLFPQYVFADSSFAFVFTGFVLAFLIAGIVKGVVGLGITTIPVGLLTALIDLKTAMALIVIPSLATNVWQASTGGNARALTSRLWPFLIIACLTIPLGALALRAETVLMLSVLLGIILIIYSAISLSGLRFTIPRSREIWTGPTMGAMNGVLTGMTGSFIFPGVVFLQGLGLPREKFIQAVGMLCTVSTIGLAFALNQRAFLTNDLTLLSATALIPTTVGMIFGQRIRNRLSETQFRRVFLLALMCLGTYIAIAGTT